MGSRLMGESPIEQGYAMVEYCGNRLSDKARELRFWTQLRRNTTQGYRAFSRQVLKQSIFVQTLMDLSLIKK